jgi:DNA primase
LITEAKPIIGLLPQGVFRQMMLDRLAELSGVESWMVRDKQSPRKADLIPRSFKKPPTLPPTLALRSVAILLKHRHMIDFVGKMNEFEKADIPGNFLLCAIIEILTLERGISIDEICKRLPSNCVSEFPIEQLKAIVETIPEEGVEQEFLGALRRLRERTREQTAEALLGQAKIRALSLEEKAELKYLLDHKEQIE